MKLLSPMFGKHSQNKHLFTMARINLRNLIQSMNKTDFYHHTAHDLGVFNGLLIAEGILLGKQPKDVPLVPPPADGKWGINKKEEVQNDKRKCDTNDKCEGSNSSNCGAGTPDVDNKESCDGTQREYGSNSDRPQSECSSEASEEDKKVSEATTATEQ
jgi:hypothetical protein